MTTLGRMTIPAGARGFDALGDPTDPARLSRDGWRFRTFYICQGNVTRLDGQKITEGTVESGLQRISAHINAGLGVLLNHEAASDRWTYGNAGGQADGRWSAGICATLGYPDGLPVIASWDTNVTARTLDTAVAYGKGFAEGLGGRWPIGVYGENSIIRALEIAEVSVLGWNVMASSWDLEPAAHATIHCQQRRPTAAEVARYPYVKNGSGGWTLDADDALLPFDAWGVVAAPAPTPAPPPPAPKPPAPAPAPAPSPGGFTVPTFPAVRNGDSGFPVYVAQAMINVRNKRRGGDGNAVVEDGRFGPQTEGVVRLIQHEEHLAEDGVVGPAQTWPVLFQG
jgi:hypothetical protein